MYLIKRSNSAILYLTEQNVTNKKTSYRSNWFNKKYYNSIKFSASDNLMHLKLHLIFNFQQFILTHFRQCSNYN